ncbi:MAG: N-acetylmuramoyl-L-alanine amidase, partial [Lachnospiraceae bacterium]|nr:N-acetylmuramoyl-L-alanine amidase [Lachnospiraceae bacterium]
MKEKRRARACALILTGFLLLLCFYVKKVSVKQEISTGAKSVKPVVVLDPGHGGIDPGKVGVSGSYEKDINLSIAKCLKKYLEKKKVSVVMTREEDAGLYTEGDRNKKSADMRARMELMNQPEVALIVSIHQNSFTSPGSKGAQVFYHALSEKGERFANRLQEILISEVDAENHRQAKANDSYYILKKSEKTAVIVECGFMSNPEEEKMLLEPEYQEKLAQAIGKGILEYLSE